MAKQLVNGVRGTSPETAEAQSLDVQSGYRTDSAEGSSKLG